MGLARVSSRRRLEGASSTFDFILNESHRSYHVRKQRRREMQFRCALSIRIAIFRGTERFLTVYLTRAYSGVQRQLDISLFKRMHNFHEMARGPGDVNVVL